MGGAKKLSLAQAEKQQKMQTSKQEQKPSGSKPKTTIEKKVGGINLPNLIEKELVAEFLKMKAVTPYQVASRYNVKLGIAQDILSKMEKSGHIKMVSRNANVKVYRTIGAA